MPGHQEPLLSREMILWLQTTCGNQAVQRLLKRKALQRAGEQQTLAMVNDRLQLHSSSKSAREHWIWWRRILRWSAGKWSRLTPASRPTSLPGD
jgi:hypothetical protein